MKQQMDDSYDDLLTDLFGTIRNEFLETRIKDSAQRIIDYVYDPHRETTIQDYLTVKNTLFNCWGVRVVEVSAPIETIDPLEPQGRQLGRCSVRILHILGPARFSIIIDETASLFEMQWALLHELGHLLLHFNLFRSMGTRYHRICMNPAMEFEIGRFIRGEKGQALRLLRETEADLFALTWLLPLWMDGVEGTENIARKHIPVGLTIQGHKFKVWRDLSSKRAESAIPKESVRLYNERGEEEKSRRESSRLIYPAEESLINRISWLFFNRPSLLKKNTVAERQLLMREYLEIVGSPRYIPELTQRKRFSHRIEPDSQNELFPRKKPDDVVRLIDQEYWEPFLVLPHDESLPEYHVPITPVPSINPLDSQAEWQHMTKATYSRPYSLSYWIEKTQQQHTGLLVFPRSPAEKVLDQQQRVR